MLLHEARLSATLSHTNIVQVYDVGQVEGRYFIAMEHIHGEDIRSIIRAMKKKGVTEFPLEHAISIILGVCAGLAYATRSATSTARCSTSFTATSRPRTSSSRSRAT
jgi:serine/threonine-protein kinase